VHLKSNDEFIGWCGLKMVNGEIDLGYRFMPAYWGKGYATEAATATLGYGHKNLQIEKITAHGHINNIASQIVLEKIRMRFVGEGMDEGLPVKGYVSFRNNHLCKSVAVHSWQIKVLLKPKIYLRNFS
jgi:[ribosomal protein S5]-alanine N-acetyltransferase